MSVPELSVVIPCVNGWSSIGECLESLERQDRNHDVEIVVANRCQDGTVEKIQSRHPQVRILNFGERCGIPELRAEALKTSTGRIVAIIEDHCMVRENWVREILRAHESGYLAVGGPIENGSAERLIDRAVFLCEYSEMMPPIREGEVDGIPGNNASYKREAFERVRQETLRECWEYFIHQEMKDQGIRFLAVPGILVNHKKKFGLRYFLVQRYHYSRSFAGMRRARIPSWWRFLYALGTPLLVPLILYRMGRQTWKKKRLRGTFAAALPLLTLFTLAYALGECRGYLSGPGNSLPKVE